MSDDDDPDWKARREEFDQHRSNFYGLIGQCVTSYQSVEDYLEKVFAAALGDDEGRAKAIFAVARGLEAKLDMISAALVGRKDDLGKHWPKLLKRVAKAAEARNQIAHATSLVRGGTVRIIMDTEKKEVVQVEQTEKDRMELRKRTKAGETIWTLDKMLAEFRRSRKLFENLIGFVRLLQGKAAQPHLLDGLE